MTLSFPPSEIVASGPASAPAPELAIPTTETKEGAPNSTAMSQGDFLERVSHLSHSALYELLAAISTNVSEGPSNRALIVLVRA